MSSEIITEMTMLVEIKSLHDNEKKELLDFIRFLKKKPQAKKSSGMI